MLLFRAHEAFPGHLLHALVCWRVRQRWDQQHQESSRVLRINLRVAGRWRGPLPLCHPPSLQPAFIPAPSETLGPGSTLGCPWSLKTSCGIMLGWWKGHRFRSEKTWPPHLALPVNAQTSHHTSLLLGYLIWKMRVLVALTPQGCFVKPSNSVWYPQSLSIRYHHHHHHYHTITIITTIIITIIITPSLPHHHHHHPHRHHHHRHHYHRHIIIIVRKKK